MATRDYTSVYTIKDFIINDIAPNYYNIDDLALLNVGLFGLTTDIGATVAQDTFNVVSRYITELIPGKSSLPEFIYAQAANYGINDVFATCSVCNATLFIREDHILEHGERDGNYTNYYIDSAMQVFIDDVPFTIPYDIRIRTRYYNNTYNHNCTYHIGNMTNTVSRLEYPYIKSYKTRITGQDTVYLAMNINLYQYSRRNISESITSNGTLNIPYVDVAFSDKLCNFEVMYTNADGDETTQLKKLLDSEPAVVSPFCYYKMVDDTTFRVFFTTNDVYFVPEYKSDLSIFIYETLGSKGNFPLYSGDNIYVSGASSSTERAYNDTVPLFCTMTSAATGGNDGFSLDDLSLLTWEASLSLKSRTTDADLDRYFESYAALYDTKALFIRLRDDFATREYACYTRLRDESDIYPTNTLTVNLTFDDVVGGYDDGIIRYIVEPGKRIGYIPGSSKNACILADDAEPQEIEYTTFALISLELNPNSIVYYLNSINKTVPAEYKYINDESLFQFIMKSFSISRNAILGEKRYAIKVTILPTDTSVLQGTIFLDDYSGDVIYEDELPSDDPMALRTDKLHVYLHTTVADNYYLELKINMEESSADTGYIFEGYIETNDIINEEKIEVTNFYSSESSMIETCSLSISEPELSVLIFYEDEEPIHHMYMSDIPETYICTLCNTFVPVTDNYYLAQPLALMRSTLSFEPSETIAGFAMNISQVPLFSRSFLVDNTEENISSILDQVSAQHDFLTNVLEDTTSNYTIHLRFFNTHGKSLIFTTDDGVALDKTFCKIRLGVKLFDGVDDSCFNDIKNTVKNYIEGLNSTESDNVNEFSVSVLFQILHDSFTDKISAMKWYGINDYGPDVQLITMQRDLSAAENINTVPEYLTVRTEDIILTLI